MNYAYDPMIVAAAIANCSPSPHVDHLPMVPNLGKAAAAIPLAVISLHTEMVPT